MSQETQGWRRLSKFFSLQRFHTLAQCVFACALTWITAYIRCVCVYVCGALQPAAISQPTYSLMEPNCLGFLSLHVNLQYFSLGCWPCVTGCPTSHSLIFCVSLRAHHFVLIINVRLLTRRRPTLLCMSADNQTGWKEEISNRRRKNYSFIFIYLCIRMSCL